MNSNNGRVCYGLMSLPMWAVMLAQFFSAFGDNVLFVVAIGLLKAHAQQSLTPWLQEAFVIAFILLAPFVGPFADSLPKGRAMFLANLVKLLGTLFVLAGGHTLIGYLVVGVGAAMYSPAKYGILGQMVLPEQLVRANGMLEGSTIAAILLGVVAGGWLADHAMASALMAVVGTYLLAALINLLIPRLVPEHPLEHINPLAMVAEFGRALVQLARDRDTRFSLIGTSVFWGSGATLRLLLFAWVPVALGVSNNETPSMLMGALSVGIVFGAVLAGALVHLHSVNRALLGGVLLGPLVLLLNGITQIPHAALVMAMVGICGGFFVIPLNALLQKRGHELVGVGHALAIQNFWDNLGMLLLVGLYMASSKAGMGVGGSVALFGAVILVGLTSLAVWRRRSGKA